MNPRHEQAAERIIKIEGLTFALASLTGKEIPTARAMLKDAICKALAEAAKGASAPGGPTGIEAAQIVTDYLKLACNTCGEGDGANIIHELYERGVRFSTPAKAKP